MSTRGEQSSDPIDAYLRWGVETKFRYFLTEQWLLQTKGLAGLLIEWKTVDAAKKGVKIASSHGLFVPRIYQGSESAEPRRYWALTVKLGQLKGFLAEATPLANQIKLTGPLKTVDKKRETSTGQEVRFVCNEEVLAAVLDDGCAFANGRFSHAMHLTRVLWLWDQDAGARGVELNQVNGPSPNCDFEYGGQWSQQHLKNIMQLAPGRHEEGYRRAGLPGLRRAAAHGPHVMDLLCGAEKWPVVFIQFSQASIDDPSGMWLEGYVFDGLNYILECAGPNTTTVVVNLSWGPQTGPHDGSTFLESYIDALVDEQWNLFNRRLIVCLPAGNSFGSRAHAQVDYATGGGVQWHVPPDGRTSAFLEIWWPPGVMPADANLRITPPSGTPEDITAGTPWNKDNWYASISFTGGSTMALVSINPTEHSDPALSGRHGVWTIEFAPGTGGAAGEIHVYVARAEHNMGARRRAKSSFLSDAALESARFVAPRKRFDEATGSVVRRAGTLNGLATGSKSSVAAGYRFVDTRVSDYSSSGRSRGLRHTPDYACVADFSEAVAGVRASAVRSGTTVRLVGTSMAAPQLGRQLVNGLNPVMPGPNPPNTPERVGAGCLEPDVGVIHKR